MRVVYIIGSHHGPKKIGVASDLMRRLAFIQTSSPVRLKILAEVLMATDVAVKVEAYAHWLLRDAHITGEWFNVLTDDAVKAVKSAVDAVARGETARKLPRHVERCMTPARLVECMAALDWSNRGLARRLDRAEGTVRKWLNGINNIPAEVAAWIELRALHAAQTPPPPRKRQVRSASAHRVQLTDMTNTARLN